MDMYGSNPIDILMNSFKENTSRSYDFVCDMDEVLVNISPPWVAKAFLNDKIARFIGTKALEFFARYDLKSLVLSRDTYLLKNWLGLDEEHGIIFDELYHDNGHMFYDNLEPTAFAKGLMGIAESPAIRRVYVMTHIGTGVNTSKRRFFEKHLASSKLELIEVPPTKKKSDVINEMDIQYVTFVDDTLSNIFDVIKNTNSQTKEFVMPRLGYNNMTEELIALAEEKYLRVGYYDSVI